MGKTEKNIGETEMKTIKKLINPITAIFFCALLVTNQTVFAESITSFDFANSGVLDSDGAGTVVTASMTILSKTQTKLAYHLDTTGFAGIFHTFDDFSTPGVETKNLISLGYSAFTIGVTAPTGIKSRFEVKDGAGHTWFKTLTSTGGSEKIYTMPFSEFLTIDFTKVKEINLILLGTDNPNAQGELTLNFGYYPFTPTVAPNPALTISDVTSLQP